MRCDRTIEPQHPSKADVRAVEASDMSSEGRLWVPGGVSNILNSVEILRTYVVYHGQHRT